MSSDGTRLGTSSLRGLLAWYRRSRRDLPWRRTRDPYALWVAEVMLQQTAVRAVLPHFESFLARFPTVQSLAAAPVEDVLALWSGLGYYHRARNLKRGAQQLVDRHAAAFPRNLPSALAVPGVGLYTASAVLSMAFGQPLAVVDGNVRRVLARVFGLRGTKWRRDAAFYNLASELIDRTSPGEWNQALMELGATLCSPRQPACDACPVAPGCEAHRQGREESYPAGRARRAPVSVTVAVAVVERDGGLLLVRRGSRAGVLAGLWELPQTSLESSGLADLGRELAETRGLDVVPGRLIATTRHSITFRRIRVEIYAARLRGSLPEERDCWRFARPDEIGTLPVSSMTHKILRALARRQYPLLFE